jgi:hypothetical protein
MKMLSMTTSFFLLACWPAPDSPTSASLPEAKVGGYKHLGRLAARPAIDPKRSIVDSKSAAEIGLRDQSQIARRVKADWGYPTRSMLIRIT